MPLLFFTSFLGGGVRRSSGFIIHLLPSFIPNFNHCPMNPNFFYSSSSCSLIYNPHFLRKTSLKAFATRVSMACLCSSSSGAHPFSSSILPCQEDQTATLLNLVLEIQLAAQLGVSSVCALRPSLICLKILFVACQFHT